jgi:HEPN domain-containing protein
VKKAEADRVIARQSSRSKVPLHDGVCFHSQQAAEKYLKAVLEELGLAVPHTHNLLDLLPLLTPHHGGLRSLRRGLDYLTRFAVETRYPGFHARRRQAVAALRWAERVRTACRSVLGVKPPRRRKK